MAKRKSALASLNFKRVDPLGLAEGQSETASASGMYHIESILPDPYQPRALLPEDLAQAVVEGRLAPQLALDHWQKRAAQGGLDSPEAHLLKKLKELAQSIAQHGLINPITIRPCDPDDPAGDMIEYRIVTGERRWWAHVYLVAQDTPIQEGHESRTAEQIKATLTPEGSRIRAHQLVENWFREDITLVEKAYGLWALRCELSGLPFGNYDEQELVNWQDVEAMLDIGRRQRRRIVRVLELSEEAQALINGHQLSERSIRPIAMRLVERPDLQVAALEQMITWIAAGERYGARRVDELIDRLLAPPGRRGRRAETTAVAFPARKFHSRVRSALKLVTDLEPAAWQQAIEAVNNDPSFAQELEELQQIIERLLSTES